MCYKSKVELALSAALLIALGGLAGCKEDKAQVVKAEPILAAADREEPAYQELRVFVLDPVVIEVPAAARPEPREPKVAREVVQAGGLGTPSPGEGLACPAPNDDARGALAAPGVGDSI